MPIVNQAAVHSTAAEIDIGVAEDGNGNGIISSTHANQKDISGLYPTGSRMTNFELCLSS